MKKNICLITLICLLVFSGCEDKFVEPQYIPEFPWTSVDKMEMGVVAPYINFFAPWSCPSAVYACYETLATDISQLIPGQTIDAPFNEFYNRLHRESALESRTMGWVAGSYNSIYKTVAITNESLAYLESDEPKKLFPNDNQSKLNEVNRQKSELYFWRGYSYYWAALFFCPPYVPGGTNGDKVIPLKTDNLNLQNTKIGTTQEIWSQVISDLAKAKTLMPLTWNKDGRVNYYGICGALARAYLYMGDYAKALKECDEIISSGKYSLPNDLMASWNKLYSSSNISSEVIWNYVPNNLGASLFSRSFFARSLYGGFNSSRGASFSQCSWVMTVMSNSALKRIGWMRNPQSDDFSLTDIAKTDKRLGGDNGFYLHLLGYKLQSETGITDKIQYQMTYESTLKSLDFPHVYFDKFYRGGSSTDKNQLTRNPQMRLTEFILMRSALKFKNGDKTGSASDLNVIRRRTGLSDIDPSILTEDDIDREYVIELAGEGVYLPYLIGLKRPILPGDRKGLEPVTAPYKNWFFRIPVDEIVKNAGYNGITDPNSLK